MIDTLDMVTDALAGMRDVGYTVLPHADGTCTIYTGDDYPDIARAVRGIIGAEVRRVRVSCSAHCTDDARPGTGKMRRVHNDGLDPVLIAIDPNRMPDMVTAMVSAAGGVVISADCLWGTVLASIETGRVDTLHRALRDHVTGFGCFAILQEL